MKRSLALALTVTLSAPIVAIKATITAVPKAAASAPGASAPVLLYTVQTGDTLYHIAQSHGLTTEALMKLNNLSSPSISVGQQLRLSAGVTATTPAAPAPTPAPTPAPVKPAPPAAQAVPAPAAAPTPTIITVKGNVVAGVTVRAPARLKMGDGFVLRLSGARAGEAQISFPSEVGEDVRRPAEVLTPIGAAGEYTVLGRVVLGKTTPVTYTVRIGNEQMKGSIPVGGLDQAIQHLNLPKSLTDRLTAPSRPVEEKIVEAAYALRTPQAWAKPFAAPIDTRSVSSGFGQPRTYIAGGEVKYHYGMDFPAKLGTPIHAVNDGKVVIAATYPVRGGLVAIDHGAGLISMYFHQSKILVKVGQTVTRGQVVGLAGTTGLSEGPHLHLEMRVRGEATLPTLYFGKLWP
ncbi:peptidoglycan DD-metalloendopeptidase family protein [Deinococcus sp. KNUC1210]|uniref:peptidoglycan DD-metalloendopeptidase family protein n=1 Tax=Deinococcus sp. KNUC1210 TaxID=2917691 RepID=UPI001EF04220|nr:peptidoglycan DD-metalloendopeptidase family protein [Deinococcus sp. KNUC1210]ULH16121.1 peptidoglycan DD-metalloendopeptidase family protein [Deinococcus sp. KNUC1210]